MVAKSLELLISDTAPYDQPETWFETYVGTHVVPMVPLLKRFWFTRYGAIGSQKWACFRFECDDIIAIQPHVDELVQRFQLIGQQYADYDAAQDIGCGENSRFLEDNGRHIDSKKRGDLAFNFLHAAALLFTDGLKGPDADGRFQREPETESGFNNETSLEQYLHLFCNMTGVPAFVSECQHPDFGRKIFAEITFLSLHKNDKRWQGLQRHRVKL